MVADLNLYFGEEISLAKFHISLASSITIIYLPLGLAF